MSYEAPQYATLSSLPPLPCLIFPTPSVYVLSLISETTLHVHTKQQEKL